MEERIPKLWTYEEYLRLPEDIRVEIIDGVIYNMSPAPSRVHQEIVIELATTIKNYLREKQPCKVYTAPLMLC